MKLIIINIYVGTICGDNVNPAAIIPNKTYVRGFDEFKILYLHTYRYLYFLLEILNYPDRHKNLSRRNLVYFVELYLK